MNQRKLIRLGNSSYAVALPKDWIDKSGLKKGDDVFIIPNSNGELIIQPTLKKNSEEKEELINLEGLAGQEKEIGRYFVSSYVGGSKLIRITGDKESLKTAKQKAKTFLNLEPVEENEKSILLKDLLDIEDVRIDNFIRRMDNNLKEMFNDLIELIENNKKSKDKTREIEEIDKDVTKFYFLIWRFMNLGVDNPAIQANLKVSSNALITHFWIAYNLELIGDEIKRIARVCEEIKNKKELIGTLNLLYESYKESMKSFFDKEKESAHKTILKNECIIKQIEKLSKIKGLEIISEKFQQINAGIHNNAKMMFYNL